MIDKNISFTSNIQFVSYSKFKKISRKSPNIGFKPDERNIIKSNEFQSLDIRTCTGGGLVRPNVEAEGFHLLDDIQNRNNFSQIIDKMFRYVTNPQRGVLIGSKELKNQDYSIPQFQDLKKIFLERVKNISIFEQHKLPLSESHIHYSVKTDTWTICSRKWTRDYNGLKVSDVSTLQELLEFFKHISIAQGDRLFIGKQEISPTMLEFTKTPV